MTVCNDSGGIVASCDAADYGISRDAAGKRTADDGTAVLSRDTADLFPDPVRRDRSRHGKIFDLSTPSDMAYETE